MSGNFLGVGESLGLSERSMNSVTIIGGMTFKDCACVVAVAASPLADIFIIIAFKSNLFCISMNPESILQIVHEESKLVFRLEFLLVGGGVIATDDGDVVADVGADASTASVDDAFIIDSVTHFDGVDDVAAVDSDKLTFGSALELSLAESVTGSFAVG